jgi:SulP family sulfate permease
MSVIGMIYARRSLLVADPALRDGTAGIHGGSSPVGHRVSDRVDLIDLAGMRKIFEQRRSEFWVALITATMVVVVGVEQGILLAIALSLIDHTAHGYRPKNAVRARSESGAWQPQPVATAAQAAPGLLIYRCTHSLYYADSQQLSDEVSFLVKAAHPPLRWLCSEASAVDDVDYSAAETLRSTYTRLKGKGVRLVLANVMEDVGAESRYRLRELFGEDAFYDRLDDVLKAYPSSAPCSSSPGCAGR